MQTGFRAKPLLAALDNLVAHAPSQPIGLVLGSGLEDKPRLWDILDKRYGVLGCNAETVRMCKDPSVFFPLLDELGIPHPETRLHPPENPEGWITKRIGGSGGRHIRFASSASRAKPRRYFQKLIEGKRISASLVVSREGTSVSQSRQWTAPTPNQPFRYGGAVSLPNEDTAAQFSVLESSCEIAQQLNLRGLVSFDFVVADSKTYLLEVNPRAGATHDIFDDADGSLFNGHILACQGQKLVIQAGPETLHSIQRAAAILHADRGAITLGKFDWPEWAADRGAPGTHIPPGAPIATVFADAATSDAAEALARARLAELETLIYESSKT
jgi:predicted ATP-grasp superfamily ATP-dependent carboligase